MSDGANEDVRPLCWIASARRDYLEFPTKLKRAFGYDLYLVRTGGHPRSAKVLHGVGAGVLELATQFDGDAYRAVYTVRFSDVVYVLHCFKKKSKRATRTPKAEIDLVRRRLTEAETDHVSEGRGQ